MTASHLCEAPVENKRPTNICVGLEDDPESSVALHKTRLPTTHYNLEHRMVAVHFCAKPFPIQVCAELAMYSGLNLKSGIGSFIKLM